MAIDVGDAILTFTLDQSQGMAQLDQLGAQIPAKMQPAQAAINATSDSVAKMTEEMAVGQNGAVKLGEVVNLAGETSRESMYQARGEAGLLGEAFGIHLPRHVRSFISELPGVGIALSAAFQATAVLFIIEALAKGIEKIIEWREESHKLELAQENFGTAIANSFNSLDEKLLRTEIRADELRGDHMAALNKEIELINKQTLGDLQHEFEVLAKAADALFKGLETGWYTFNLGSKGAEAALTDFKAKFDFLLATGQKKEATDLLAGTKQSAEEVLALMIRFQNLKGSPNDSLEETNRKSAEALKLVDELKQRGAAYDDKAIKAQETFVALLNAQVNAQKEIEKTADKATANKKTEEADRAAADADRILKAQADAEKRASEQEDKDEDERRNKFIASFEEQEKEKIAATKQGSDARLQIIDAAIKDEEAHGFQDTAFYRSLQVQRVQAVQARIDQQQKAQQKADTEELKTIEDQAKREVDAAKVSASGQEKALQDLGKAKILSQSETSSRLIAAYEQEKTRVLTILQNLLREEQALMTRATKKLADAKLNPGVTPEQIQQAETLLEQLQRAVANTEGQIAKTMQDFHNRELALDKSYYGEALALAVAFGKQELAARLQANHAALVSAQAQLLDAKARGVNTHSIDLQIKALQKHEKELVRDTAQQTKQHSLSLSQFAQLSKTLQAYEAELDRSGSKAAAWGASLGTVISGVAEAWAQGGVSIEQALAKVAAAEISAIAQVAEKEGTKQLALAFGSYPDAVGMAHHFGAAALWFALGGGLSAASGALSGGGSSGKSSAAASGGSAGPAANSPNVNSQQPSQVVNVTHLAAGGLVTGPTLAVVGDRSGGGSAREAVIPLDNSSAMKAIASAITAQMKGLGEIHIRMESDIPYVARVINKGAREGTIRVYATHAKDGTALSK